MRWIIAITTAIIAHFLCVEIVGVSNPIALGVAFVATLLALEVETLLNDK